MLINQEEYVNLESSLIGMNHDVEKLRCMVESLCEYFSVQDIQADQEKQYDVIFKYSEMRLFAEITLDYTNKLNGELVNVWEQLEEARPAK